MDSNQENEVWDGISALSRGHVVNTPQGVGYYMGASYEGELYCKVVLNYDTLDVAVADISQPSEAEVSVLLEEKRSLVTY